jgi:hypothetical protein
LHGGQAQPKELNHPDSESGDFTDKKDSLTQRRSAASRNQSWIDHKERKDRKEKTGQVVVSAFFVFFAVKMLLELHDSPLLHCTLFPRLRWEKEVRLWRTAVT